MSEHDIDNGRRGHDSNTEPRNGDLAVRLDRLGIANHLGAAGIDGVADRLGHLGGKNVEVEAGRVATGYVDQGAVTVAFSDDHRVAVRVRLRGPPHGYVLVLFSLESANRAATFMLSNTVENLDATPNELAHDAVKELGGMMAYGFMDALADIVEREIDVGTPKLSSDNEADVVRRTVASEDGIGLYLASTVRLPEEDVAADVYLFPGNATFIRMLSRIELEEVA